MGRPIWAPGDAVLRCVSLRLHKDDRASCDEREAYERNQLTDLKFGLNLVIRRGSQLGSPPLLHSAFIFTLSPRERWHACYGPRHVTV